jgi:hypothetical protein
MPKAKYRENRGKKSEVRTYKFKLGNRKSSISAHTVSTKELIEQYNAPRIPKDKPKIARILHLRGVSLATPHVDEELLTENEIQ